MTSAEVHRFVEARMVYYSQPNERGLLNFFNAQPNNLRVRGEKLIKLGTLAYREGVVCLRPFDLKFETHEFF
jgi:hypothetical protein